MVKKGMKENKQTRGEEKGDENDDRLIALTNVSKQTHTHTHTYCMHARARNNQQTWLLNN